MDSTAVSLSARFITSEIIFTLFGVLSTVLIATITSYLTYRYTRKTRLEAEWRIDKLSQYREYLSSLSRMVNWRSEGEFDSAMKDFAHSTNTLSLVAPKHVLDAAIKVCDAINRLDNDKSKEADDNVKGAIRALVLAFRKDLDLEPEDNKANFRFVLQAGQSKKMKR